MNAEEGSRKQDSFFFFFYNFLCHSAEKPQPHRWSKEDFQSDWAQSGALRRQQKARGRQRRAWIQHQHLLPGAGRSAAKVPRDLQQTRAEPIPVKAARNRHAGDWMRAWSPAVGCWVLADQHWAEMRLRSLDGWTLRRFAGLMRASLSSFYMQLKCTIRFSWRDKRIHYHVFRASQNPFVLCGLMRYSK